MSKLTLDGAIKHCLEVAEKEEQFCVQDDRSCLFQKSHAECAADHRQLAEWLTELKELESKHWDECRQIAHYDDEIKRLEAADVQPVNQWISVNDRLPENCIEVLVYDTDCGIVIGWYDNEIGDFAADFISPLDAVTHWQPLPEPPKDGDTN